MIQANELRIGNWIADHEAGGYFQIEEICKVGNQYNVSYRKGSIKCAVDVVEFVPLTEEWLIKFGFKQYTDFGVKFNTFDLMPLCGFAYDTDTKQVIIQEKRNSMSHYIERKIEYVHELQNLYFALRGQELTIKN